MTITLKIWSPDCKHVMLVVCVEQGLYPTRVMSYCPEVSHASSSCCVATWTDERAYTKGDNTDLIATDTMRNTVRE